VANGWSCSARKQGYAALALGSSEPILPTEMFESFAVAAICQTITTGPQPPSLSGTVAAPQLHETRHSCIAQNFMMLNDGSADKDETALAVLAPVAGDAH
jgi:hypothetical protein